MGRYIVKRLGYSIVSLFSIVTLIFFLMHAVPGRPYTGERALPTAIEANVRSRYSLDKPLSRQYLIMLKNIAALDFGMSMKNDGRGVNDIIRTHFPVRQCLAPWPLLSALLPESRSVFYRL